MKRTVISYLSSSLIGALFLSNTAFADARNDATVSGFKQNNPARYQAHLPAHLPAHYAGQTAVYDVYEYVDGRHVLSAANLSKESQSAGRHIRSIKTQLSLPYSTARRSKNR